jgi:hypothetical protein
VKGPDPALPFTALHDLLTGDEDARACRDIDDAACREQPRNVGVHVAALSLTKIGDGLADAKLILSWLLSALGAPAAAVAMLVPVREALALLPQLAVAAHLRRLAVRKWLWVLGAAAQGVALLMMAAVAMTARGDLAGWLLVALLALFSLARGVCSVAYKDVLGKTVSKGRRGMVGGHASRAAGVAVLALGLVLLLVPEQDRGVDFLAGLLCLGAGLWFAAAAIFASLAEHPGATEGGANALGEALSSLALIARDGQLALFLASRALLAASALMAPFLVLLAREMGQQDLTSLGMLVLASGAAGAVSASFWGRFSDRSSRLVMASAGALAGAAGLAAAALGTFAPAAPGGLAGLALAALYFLLALAHTGIRLGRKTHLVDMAGSAQRASYVAVSNTVIGIVLLAGGLFGVLADTAGVVLTVAVLAVLALAGSACALALREVQSSDSSG